MKRYARKLLMAGLAMLTALVFMQSAEACPEGDRLQGELEKAYEAVSSSVTATGALSDLPALRQAWSNFLFHMRTCPECRKEIGPHEEEFEKELTQVNQAMTERLDALERELRKRSFDEGVILGGILNAIFGGS